MTSEMENYWDEFFPDDNASDEEMSKFVLERPDKAKLAKRRLLGDGGIPLKKPRLGDSARGSTSSPSSPSIIGPSIDVNNTTPIRGIVRPVERGGVVKPAPVPFYHEKWSSDGISQVKTVVMGTQASQDDTVELEDGEQEILTSTPKMSKKKFICRPDFSFEGHNPATDDIGVFYDEDGDLVMEVGIDRVVRFIYRSGGEIEGYRCIPANGGPADHHVSISFQRWHKMRQVEGHIQSQIQEIFAGNSVETKVHLGGLYFIQVSSRYSNVQIRQYAAPNNGSRRLYATKFGISMSIPEYAYFTSLVQDFSDRITALEGLIPCYDTPQHSDSCVECYPMQKHKNSTSKTEVNGGGRRFLAQPGKRGFPFGDSKQGVKRSANGTVRPSLQCDC